MKEELIQPADFLHRILRSKSERLKSAEQVTQLEEVRNIAIEIRRQATSHALREELLREEKLNVIAEFKRRSPSKGVIRSSVDPVTVARSYVAGGAAAISVLTEEDHFDGSIQDLRSVKVEVELPVLRKDFIFDPYQLYESAAAGADGVLLIVAALDDITLRQLRETAENTLGMDALVEVHDEGEMKRAVASGATLVGVNNRNLRNFEVSLEVSKKLIHHANRDTILISESGLQTHKDLQCLFEVGYRGFLVGERLMRADNPAEGLRALIEG